MVETSTYSFLPRQCCLEDFWGFPRGCPPPQPSSWTSESLSTPYPRHLEVKTLLSQEFIPQLLFWTLQSWVLQLPLCWGHSLRPIHACCWLRVGSVCINK